MGPPSSADVPLGEKHSPAPTGEWGGHGGTHRGPIPGPTSTLHSCSNESFGSPHFPKQDAVTHSHVYTRTPRKDQPRFQLLRS